MERWQWVISKIEREAWCKWLGLTLWSSMWHPSDDRSLDLRSDNLVSDICHQHIVAKIRVTVTRDLPDLKF